MHPASRIPWGNGGLFRCIHKPAVGYPGRPCVTGDAAGLTQQQAAVAMTTACGRSERERASEL
ncbi:MAG: hypothetical protein H0U13_08230 [Gemmatimonadaceae bacterium]|nr:hypothetical protein [Gemmatimonadaceae bacterium]